MGLIKTEQELKKAVNVSGTGLAIESIQPHLDEAEAEYIESILGPELYQELTEKYDLDTLTAKESQLLSRIQKVIANFAYANSAAVGQLEISDAGWRINTGSDYKTAFSWQIEAATKHLIETAYGWMEKALRFLEKEKALFPSWVNSEAYTVNKKLLINSASDFSERYNIQNSILTYKALQPALKKVEDFIIAPAITEQLYLEVKQQIKDNSLSPDNLALLPYLQDVSAYLTIWKAIPSLSLQVTDQGLRVNMVSTPDGKSSQPAADPRIQAAADSAYLDGMQYLSKLKKYLDQTATEQKYSSYFAAKQAAGAPISEGSKIYRAG